MSIYGNISYGHPWHDQQFSGKTIKCSINMYAYQKIKKIQFLADDLIQIFKDS